MIDWSWNNLGLGVGNLGYDTGEMVMTHNEMGG